MIGELLPFAIGILLSPFPVLPLIVLLGAPRPLGPAGGYLFGWGASLLVVVVVFELLGELLERPPVASPWLLVVKGAIGIALIGLGVRQWIQSRNGDAEPPSWLASLTDTGAGGAARFGATMAAGNPKIIVFAAGAGVAIGSADLPLPAVVGWSVVMVVLSSLVLILLYVARAFLGDSAAPALQRLNTWLLRHGKTLTAGVLVVLGVIVTAKAVTG